jgi:glycosyltransferase involved in cell wall biosynthesis
MRIAIIAEVFLPKVDGVVHRTVNLISELQRHSDQVLVVCPQADGSRNGLVPVVEFPSFSFPLYPEYRVGLPDKRLAKEVEQFAPDVLHYVNPFAFGFRCYEVLRKAGIQLPTVFSFHTLYGEFVKRYRTLRPLSHVIWWMMREYHNRADVNLTVSNIMQDELVRRGFARVRCWPPAVDSQLFHPHRRSDAMRARLANDHPQAPLLLTVSRLAPEKNVDFLAGILDQVPDACLAVVGDGPQRGELERRFAGRKAHFLGYLKGEELAAAYASADAFVYASETETLGNVILEAMACGCAIVAPQAGGIPSLVSHGKNGMLFQPGNLDDAVRWTRQMLTNEDVRTRLGQAARHTVEQWSWENGVERVRQTYREAIEGFWPGRRRRRYGQRVAQGVTTGLVHTFQALAALRSIGRSHIDRMA